MVDDKVAGFEAGVDDYMTKPTHPAELVSRVKALTSAAAASSSAATCNLFTATAVDRSKGYWSFSARRVGLGVTTLALNGSGAGAVGQETIACEVRAGQGSLGLLLVSRTAHPWGIS